jgi:predicted DNA-binding protein with PD1-like motif
MRCDVTLQHEEGSVQMFEYLLEQNKLQDTLTTALPELKDKAVQFIKELIRGKGTLKKNKRFLYQVHLHIHTV